MFTGPVAGPPSGLLSVDVLNFDLAERIELLLLFRLVFSKRESRCILKALTTRIYKHRQIVVAVRL